MGDFDAKVGKRVQWSASVQVFTVAEGATYGILPTGARLSETYGLHDGSTAAERIEGRRGDRSEFFHSKLLGEKKRKVFRSSRRHSLKWLISGMI